MYAMKDAHTQPYMLEVHLKDVPVQMELDTGAAVSIIMDTTYKFIQHGRSLLLSSLRRASSKPTLDITSRCWALQGSRPVRYDKDELCSWSGLNLLGRDWITNLKVNLNPQWHPLNPYRPS